MTRRGARRGPCSSSESKPAEHNLVLTLLDERAAHPEPGRFWWAARATRRRRASCSSPRSTSMRPITPAPPDAVAALADMPPPARRPISPACRAKAATAAYFAGCWAERLKTPAAPVEGQRLYALGRTASARRRRRTAPACGRRRRRSPRRGGWRDSKPTPAARPLRPDVLRRRITEGLVWIWDDGGPVSMAALTPMLAGVTRVGLVYTPPEHRRHGYAAACTAAVSQVGARRWRDALRAVHAALQSAVERHLPPPRLRADPGDGALPVRVISHRHG